MDTNVKLSSLSETVKELLLDGIEARKMEDEQAVALSYKGSSQFSYIVAKLNITFTSADDLLKALLLGKDCVTSLRFY